MGRAEFIANVRHLAWGKLSDRRRTAETNHENWMQMKKEWGWKYGRVKDFEAKTHPDLVPYDQLSEIEKRKDKSDMIVHTEVDRLWAEVKGAARAIGFIK